ncbi:hypothetical protein T484DRAFT_1971372 [Baffinella frigidus]|nr:hypothetical protein T484DRAFT_1971372 [Cryptophyta sp. CCMP2293]
MHGIQKWSYRPPTGKGRQEHSPRTTELPPVSIELPPVAPPSQRPFPPRNLNYLGGALGPVAPSVQQQAGFVHESSPAPQRLDARQLPGVGPAAWGAAAGAARTRPTAQTGQTAQRALSQLGEASIRSMHEALAHGSSVPAQPIAQVSRALALLQTEGGAQQHYLGLMAANARSGGDGP